MKLGLKRDEVRIVEYTPGWQEEFNRVRKELVEYTNMDEHRIQHIGSTAIRGMAAKPIIDLVVGVDDLGQVDKPLLKNFNEAGFLRLKVERPEEIVLAKFTDDTYEEKTHFIHLVEYQKELWNNLIFFRDYLNSNETARKEYLDIKREYLKNSSTGVSEYTNFKEAFVRSIFEKRRS
ncbi:MULTISPECIES: GrpB family protein [Pontibacillus]|uniref:GrpB family protein n=1 Tax=Pontibacillus chungwhensis TaxID=265426 RepID=A0ABY8V1B6_9BACI|nr:MULTISPECIES: GrpB family protein [Pontibacillus]MCD5324411.1 GrpB family protein [Pontibacillus sp. HN14]WIF99293.1 GrpB family protein [Pontibacillus chungwhensis]